MTDTAATPADATAAAPESAADDAPRSAKSLVLDHLEDSDGPQSVAEIVAACPGVDRNAVDQALHRLVEAEQVERVDRGLYRLAPPKPKPPPAVKPAAPAQPPLPKSGLEAFMMSDAEGHPLPPPAAGQTPPPQNLPPPPAPPAPIGDDDLLTQLLKASGGNIATGGSHDLAPVRAMLADGVALDDILRTLREKVNRSASKYAATLHSWGEPRFLRHVAVEYLRRTLVPAMIESWTMAAQGKPVQRPEPLDPALAPPAPEIGSRVPSQHVELPFGEDEVPPF